MTDDARALALATQLGVDHKALAQRLRRLVGSGALGAMLSAIHEAEAVLETKSEAWRAEARNPHTGKWVDGPGGASEEAAREHALRQRTVRLTGKDPNKVIARVRAQDLHDGDLITRNGFRDWVHGEPIDYGDGTVQISFRSSASIVLEHGDHVSVVQFARPGAHRAGKGGVNIEDEA